MQGKFRTAFFVFPAEPGDLFATSTREPRVPRVHLTEYRSRLGPKWTSSAPPSPTKYETRFAMPTYSNRYIGKV